MKKIIARLKKVSGQINGISKMIEEGKECENVIIQFQAAKAALDRAFSEVLSMNLKSCLKGKNPYDLDKILNLITKYEH